MFASTLGAVLLSIRGHNRERAGGNTQISPETLGEGQTTPPLKPHNAGGRALDTVQDPDCVNTHSEHNGRLHHRSIVARLASSVEVIEARLDLQERKLQRIAGQVATNTCGPFVEAQFDHKTATAEGREKHQKANTSGEPPSGEPPIERPRAGADAGVSHTTSTSMRTRSVKKSSKKAGRNRRLHDLRINGTPKFDLHHGSNNLRYGLVKSQRYNRCYRLKRGNDNA